MTAATAPLRYVIDASVGFKWLVEEEGSAQADALLDALDQPEAQFHVPQLFYIEIANILWKAVRQERIEAEAAGEALAQLGLFGLQSHDTETLSGEALAIVLAYGVTAYDASYVALGKLLELPLITADDPLRRKLNGSFDVRLLSEVIS